jgi:DNA-binding transcriptional LysR family regulator
VQSNSVDVHAAAAQAGAGLAVLPCAIGDTRPGLRRLEPPEPPPAREFWLGFHEDLRHTLRVRELVKHIASELQH